MKADAPLQFCKQRLNLLPLPLSMFELWRIPEISRALSSGFIHVDGKEAKRPSGALRLQRAWPALGTCPDVSKGAVPVIAASIV